MKIASFERTIQLIRAHQFLKAEEEATHMIWENPSHFAGYLCLSYVQFKKQNLVEAAENIEQAINCQPLQIESYQLAVAIYKEMKKNKRVCHFARLGIKHDHTNAYFYFELAEHLSVSFSEREPLYEKALHFDPENVNYLGRYSELLVESGTEWQKAWRMESLAIALEPYHQENLLIFAKTNYERGNFEQAREYVERVLTGDSGNKEALELREEFAITESRSFALYEKVRLFLKRKQLSVSCLIVASYMGTVLLLWWLIGISALLCIIVPLVFIIRAIFLQIEAGGKETIQKKQNRYIRLPIAIFALLILLIPLGIHSLAAFYQTVSVDSTHLTYGAKKVVATSDKSQVADHRNLAQYQKIEAIRDLYQKNQATPANLKKYIAKPYLAQFDRAMKNKENYVAFMNFRFSQMFVKDRHEQLYLMQENKHHSLIIAMRDNKIIHIYRNNKEKETKSEQQQNKLFSKMKSAGSV
ncbi:hypothetical protein [Listeria sp. PSOL-1]|uniref:tetratricopeptide repeat protein n=1 Tax=Listeria sp. PSOL-1 TaxID=1844999 RepID=UPI0013D4C3C4|nr:hypothetical protein [Listeria sp. PSOL-1]